MKNKSTFTCILRTPLLYRPKKSNAFEEKKKMDFLFVCVESEGNIESVKEKKRYYTKREKKTWRGV